MFLFFSPSFMEFVRVVCIVLLIIRQTTQHSTINSAESCITFSTFRSRHCYHSKHSSCCRIYPCAHSSICHLIKSRLQWFLMLSVYWLCLLQVHYPILCSKTFFFLILYISMAPLITIRLKHFILACLFQTHPTESPRLNERKHNVGFIYFTFIYFITFAWFWFCLVFVHISWFTLFFSSAMLKLFVPMLCFFLILFGFWKW